MRITVTGGSAHIGANLVRSLLKNGHSLRCLVHVHTRGLDGLDVERTSGDLLDVDSLYRAFDGAEIV